MLRVLWNNLEHEEFMGGFFGLKSVISILTALNVANEHLCHLGSVFMGYGYEDQ